MQELKSREKENLEVLDNWPNEQAPEAEESEPARMPLFNEFFEERDPVTD